MAKIELACRFFNSLTSYECLRSEESDPWNAWAMNSEFYSRSFFVIFNESISFWRSRLINSLTFCVLFCQITLGRMHFPCLHPWNTVEGRYDASEHYNLSLSFRIRWQLNRISTQDCSWHLPMDSKHCAKNLLQIVQSIAYHAKFGWWLPISETATEKFIRAKKKWNLCSNIRSSPEWTFKLPNGIDFCSSFIFRAVLCSVHSLIFHVHLWHVSTSKTQSLP